MKELLKRCLTALALVSMINMTAVVGLVGFMWSRHYLEPQRVRLAWDALSGHTPEAMPATMPSAGPDGAKSDGSKGNANAASDEILHAELERRRREIQNGWDLLERQQIALVSQREKFEEEKKQFQAVIAAQSGKTADEGFKKELDIIAGLKAKSAKELLRLKSEADVVRMLSALEPRTARKIVSECKKSEERRWIGRILEKMSQQGVAQAEVLNAAE